MAINLHLIPYGSVYKFPRSTIGILMKCCRTWGFNREPIHFIARLNLFWRGILAALKFQATLYQNIYAACMQLTMGVHMWVCSLKKPQHNKQVMCSVRHQPGLELMHVKLMFYRESLYLPFSCTHGTSASSKMNKGSLYDVLSVTMKSNVFLVV